MFSVTSSSSSSRPSTDLLSSLAALASAGLVSAGGPATVKGKKSNQQQSDHLICEVRECSEHFSSPVSTYFLITRVAVEVYFLIIRLCVGAAVIPRPHNIRLIVAADKS